MTTLASIAWLSIMRCHSACVSAVCSCRAWCSRQTAQISDWGADRHPPMGTPAFPCSNIIHPKTNSVLWYSSQLMYWSTKQAGMFQKESSALFPNLSNTRSPPLGGQGATLSTFPLVPLTREPTCDLNQAIDPGISRSTLTPADTSRPSRSSGHFPDFPWPGSPWLAHGSPLHGDRFPNPMGLLLCAFGLPALPMSHSPLPHPGTGPFPASHGLPTPPGRLTNCAALAKRPSPPRPLVPSSRVYTPPGRLLYPVALAHWGLFLPGTASCA